MGKLLVSIICIRCIFEIPTRAVAIRSLDKPHGPASHGGFEEASESDSWLIYRLELSCIDVLFACCGIQGRFAKLDGCARWKSLRVSRASLHGTPNTHYVATARFTLKVVNRLVYQACWNSRAMSTLNVALPSTISTVAHTIVFGLGIAQGIPIGVDCAVVMKRMLDNFGPLVYHRCDWHLLHRMTSTCWNIWYCHLSS